VVDEQLLLRDQLVEIEAQRPDVRGQLFGRLLEGDEHPGVAMLDGAPYQEFRGKQRLAAAGGSADEARPPEGKATAGDLVQALYSGGRLG